jgi:hypothetical protein
MVEAYASWIVDPKKSTVMAQRLANLTVVFGSFKAEIQPLNPLRQEWLRAWSR